MVGRRFVVAFLALVFWSAGACAASLTAETDRTELYVNEHVLLTLSLADSDTRLRAEGVSPNVDLTTLAADFELGTPQADFRFNIERHRGRATSTLRVALFPKRPGRLTIPPFTVDGVSTRPIELNVRPLAADARPEVFVRSGLARDRVHAGEQTLLWLDLYHRVALASARLGGPLETEPRAVEAHALPAAERAEEVDGLTYRVTRTAWAVSPLAAGEVTFFLPDVWVETAGDRRWRLPFREERLHAIALPEGLAAGTLIGRPGVEASLPERARAGEPVRWEVTVRSRTALNGLPPELPIADAPGLAVYQDRPERVLDIVPGEGEVESVVRYTGHLLPGVAGDLAMPEIGLDWYDPATGNVETLTITGSPIAVSPAPVAPERALIPVAGPPAVPERSPGWWPWIAGGFAALWIATLLAVAWRYRSRRFRPAPAGPAVPAGPKERLLAALGATTLERGLGDWEARHGPDTELRDAVRAVQRICYGGGRRGNGGIDEGELARAVETALSRLEGRDTVTGGPAHAEADPWSPQAFHRSPVVSGPEG